MAERDPFGPMPIDNNEPTDIVAQIPETIKVLSEDEAKQILEEMKAAIAKGSAVKEILGTIVAIAKPFLPLP